MTAADLESILRHSNASSGARARALGFDALGVARIEIPEDERHLQQLARGTASTARWRYMQRHGTMRSRPQQLQPGTVRV